VEHDKRLQCEAARNRYYMLRDARRLFERDADAKREEARQVMAAVC
jgi:hypothetical protein